MAKLQHVETMIKLFIHQWLRGFQKPVKDSLTMPDSGFVLFGLCPFFASFETGKRCTGLIDRNGEGAQ
jgi:hypothetical protein